MKFILKNNRFSFYGLIICSILQVSCTGTTAGNLYRFVEYDGNREQITPYALQRIDITSIDSTFSSSSELAKFQSSLKKVIRKTRVFGNDKSNAYTLEVIIKDFSIPIGSLGGFAASMTVAYKLVDNKGDQVFDIDIDSYGADDTGSFAGVARQNRSRTLTAANNISNFIETLQQELTAHQAKLDKKYLLKQAQLTSVKIPTLTQQPLLPIPNTVDPSKINFGRYFALIIGNNDYQFVNKLETAINDARSIEAILKNDYGFTTELLLNASRYQILSKFNQFRMSMLPTDNLLIFYAGHGWLDQDANEGYWLPVDSEPDNPVNWISNASITSSLRAIPAKHILVIADSCFSGKLIRGIKPMIRTQNYLQRLASKRSRTVMTSGGIEPVADAGGKGNHSVFASALLKALDENQSISEAGQLFTQIRYQVVLEADQTPEYSDIRKAGHDGGEFLFIR